MFNSLGFDPGLVFRYAPAPSGILRKWLPLKRELPRIFIAGAQKSGTTSLYFHLLQHPNIAPPLLKEPFFFGNDDRYCRGLSFYRPNFPPAVKLKSIQKKTGSAAFSIDATTNYLDHPEAAERIRQHVPDAKAIILLREPVSRTYSQYKMARNRGFENLSFEEALGKEEERIAAGSNEAHNYCYQRLAYRKRSEYARMLPPWLKTFGQKQLLVLCAEEYYANTAGIFQQVLEFLELPAFTPPDLKPENTSAGSKLPEEKTQLELQSYFRPWNEKLATLLNREFPWNYA
jgi:hypothetical protein